MDIPVKQLVKHLKDFYKQLQQIDPIMIIYAYDDWDPSEAIFKPSNMLSDISIYKKFFNNISIKPNGGYTWFPVWLKHDDSVANILSNMKYWSSEHDIYIFKKNVYNTNTLQKIIV